jgi:hypothetical protein
MERPLEYAQKLLGSLFEILEGYIGKPLGKPLGKPK